MDRNMNLLIIGDMNNEQGRALVQAMLESPDLNVPYGVVHIGEVHATLPGIRATPAVGVLMWASDLQEAVAIADVAREAAYLGAREAVTEALDNAPDAVAVTLPVEIYNDWAPGESYATGKLLKWLSRLYRVVQPVIAQEHQPPNAEGMLAIYRPIDPSHSGTLADPVPWVYGMDCAKDLYYSYNGLVYLCKANMIPCTWVPDTPGMWQWETVQNG